MGRKAKAVKKAVKSVVQEPEAGSLMNDPRRDPRNVHRDLLNEKEHVLGLAASIYCASTARKTGKQITEEDAVKTAVRLVNLVNKQFEKPLDEAAQGAIKRQAEEEQKQPSGLPAGLESLLGGLGAGLRVHAIPAQPHEPPKAPPTVEEYANQAKELLGEDNEESEPGNVVPLHTANESSNKN